MSDRSVGGMALLAAIVLAAVGGYIATYPGAIPLVEDRAVSGILTRGVYAAAALVGVYGVYRLVFGVIEERVESKRRLHDLSNVLRLVFGIAAIVSVFAVLTAQWLGLLFSLGIVGFAVTFALQQPLFSLIGWFYIMVKRPYQVGDRVAIEDSKGDVVGIDFFVTTLWEIDGELVAGNQPSGRIITLPNSVVLSSHVYNYSWAEFPYVWNEVDVEIAYETDLDFATETMIEVADDFLGDEMSEHISHYRERLAETPVELEVRDRPTVNITQHQSWVELRVRYLVHPKRGQRTKNELYRRILEEFNANPDRVKFPVGRNR